MNWLLKDYEMKALGKGLCVIGVVMIFVGMSSILYCIYYAFAKNIAFEDTLTDINFQSERLDLDTRKHVMVSVMLDIESPSTVKKTDSDGSESYEVKYQFPFRYQFIDEGGQIVYEAEGEIKTGSSREDGYLDGNEFGGSTGGEFALDKIKITQSPVTLKFMLGPDTRYLAAVSNATIMVYDNTVPYTVYIISAAALIPIGVLLLVISIVMMLSSLSSATRQRTAINTTQTSSSHDLDAVFTPSADNYNETGIASAAHFSAFSGYFIPFGGLLGPLIVWLIGRDKSDFVDDQGAEVLNFRISLLIYYFVSAILMFVLIGFILVFILMFADIVLTIVGGIKAAQGERFRYPFNIRFVKPAHAPTS
jgi:uncharacterized Tic20 family protein